MKIETKASLGDLIYYLMENKVRSAKVLSIQVTVNSKENLACTILTPFGEAGVWYGTCHGIFRDENIFLSKRELAEDLIGEEEK